MRQQKHSPPDSTDLPAGAAAVRIAPLRIGGVRTLVIDLPDDPLEMPAGLTAAEREVVRLLLSGLSTGEMARLRGSSYRTVANQLAAIYRKAGVASRAELVASLGRR